MRCWWFRCWRPLLAEAPAKSGTQGDPHAIPGAATVELFEDTFDFLDSNPGMSRAAPGLSA